uniref:Coiled-coil domain containing 170 n=1 Tax=Amphiprion percula TaxID=161767 RepID=A0A3P8TBC9_AMPPE
MRIAVLEESVKSCEVECKASRETVLRLVAELDQERRKTASSAAALDSLKVVLIQHKTVLNCVYKSLTERLEASRRVIEAARRESQCLEKQVEELERKTQAAEGKVQMFLEKVAEVLSTALALQTVSDMEARLSRVSEQLSEQTELRQSTQQRSELAEQQVQDLRERLQSLEAELTTADMHRDGLRHSKQQYEEFLEQLSEMMKVDSIAVDLGFDMRLKLILSRAEQLVKHEGKALVETKSLTYSLQRKLKSQKDQLESKGLHIQLLRKKLSELEDEKRSRSALAVERDDAHLEVRRLQKKVERLQGELKATKLSNTELKAQLSHTNELKVEGKRPREEDQRRPAAAQQPQTEFGSAVRDPERGEGSTVNMESLQHLVFLKIKRTFSSIFLSSIVQLVDFRMVVSQMLGLDATSSTLSNYEIITLLENLLHAHHHLHHHLNPPCRCSIHQWPHHLLQILPDSSTVDVSTCRSSSGDAVRLHET